MLLSLLRIVSVSWKSRHNSFCPPNLKAGDVETAMRPERLSQGLSDSLVSVVSTEAQEFNASWAEFGYTLDHADLKRVIEKSENDEVEAIYWVGVILGEKKELEMAERALLRVITSRPHHARAWNNLGSLALRRGDVDSAKKAFESAIAFNPELYEPYCNLGVLHHEQGDVLGAVRYFERAEQLSPHDPVLLCNLAMARWERGEYAHARKTIKYCLERNQDHADAKYIESFMALAHGEFSTGWNGYKYRNGRMTASGQLQIPFWCGEDLKGRTILVTPEQGLGEQIIFGSCIPDLLNLDVHCIFVCADKLKELFQRTFPAVVVLGAGEVTLLKSFGPIDFQVSIADLGSIFRTDKRTILRGGAYLKVDPVSVELWRMDLLKLGEGLKVGISWKGGSPKTGGTARSIPLLDWSPILRVKPVHFINLQYGDCSEEITKIESVLGKKIISLPVAHTNLYRTAELVSALDLVICVDTSLAYLCAGLGKAAWILLPTGPSWPYQISEPSSPWFPSAKFYRMSLPQDWREPIERVAKDLEQFHR